MAVSDVDLLAKVLEAHGGLERWQALRAVTVVARFGGLLRARLPGNKMARVHARVELDRQRTVFVDFPQAGQRAIFDAGVVHIENAAGDVIATRSDPRAAFRGVGALRRNFRWDALDATYFAGYAWWNYLATPLHLARHGAHIREGDPWHEAGEKWRRLEVTFEPDLHTHSRQQTFYADSSGLIRRHDYVAEPVGRWARAAHYSAEHRAVDGFVFATHRRVRPIGPRNRSLPGPTLVSLDIERVEVET